MLIKFFKYIGIYGLGLSCIWILARFHFLDGFKGANSMLLFVIVFGLPFVWAHYASHFFKGAGIFFSALLIINFALPGLSSKGKFNDDQEISLNGNYSTAENGMDISVTIRDRVWFGEIREGNHGGLFSSESGIIDGKKLRDKYGTDIGSVDGQVVHLEIQGYRYSLFKN